MLHSLATVALHFVVMLVVLCPIALLVDRMVLRDAFSDPVTNHMGAVAVATTVILFMVTLGLPWYDDLPVLTGLLGAGLFALAYVVGRAERAGIRYNPYRHLLERFDRRRAIEHEIDQL